MEIRWEPAARGDVSVVERVEGLAVARSIVERIVDEIQLRLNQPPVDPRFVVWFNQPEGGRLWTATCRATTPNRVDVERVLWRD